MSNSTSENLFLSFQIQVFDPTLALTKANGLTQMV